MTEHFPFFLTTSIKFFTVASVSPEVLNKRHLELKHKRFPTIISLCLPIFRYHFLVILLLALTLEPEKVPVHVVYPHFLRTTSHLGV